MMIQQRRRPVQFPSRSTTVLNYRYAATALVLLVVTTTTTTKPTMTAHGYPFELDFSVIGNDQTPRVLQTSGGRLPDLGAPSEACNSLGGSRFFCDIFQKVGYESDFMNLNISIQCFLDATIGYDFRRASGCSCTTLLTPSNASRLPKTCPCYVCPKDFGSSSVSIDCSYLVPNTTDSSVAPSDMPSSTPSESPVSGGGGGGGGGGASSSPTAPPSVPKTGTSSAGPVMGGGGGGGGGQGIPIQPTTAPGTGVPAVTPGSTAAPSTAKVSVPAAPTQAPQQQVQRNRNVQAVTTSAPSPSAPLVTDNNNNSSTTNSTTTNTTNATDLPDPYIFNTCVSVDCGGNCNGTCSLGCDDPTAKTLCSFCEGAAGSPTFSPTGSDGGGGGVPTIGGTSGAASLRGSGGVVSALLVGWIAATTLVRADF